MQLTVNQLVVGSIPASGASNEKFALGCVIISNSDPPTTVSRLFCNKEVRMNVDQASNFLVGSILTCMGFVVIVIAVVAINNIIHKYWKSFGWKFFSLYDPLSFEDRTYKKYKDVKYTFAGYNSGQLAGLISQNEVGSIPAPATKN